MILACVFAVTAVLIYLWPSPAQQKPFKLDFRAPEPEPIAAAVPDPTRRPNFRMAVDSLAYVRSRLVVTDTLTEPTKAAIDTLTLALVSGSDKA